MSCKITALFSVTIIVILLLQQVIDSADDRMAALERQWVAHQMPLTKQIESLKSDAISRQDRIEQKLAEIQEYKKQMKSAAQEAKTKDDLVKSLVTKIGFSVYK